ncbi:MAG: DNA cytosine methyltransferase [Mobilitalea sp.]
MKEKNVIDLFCGCGGLSYGFKMAGFNVLLGIDNWEDALITYQNNLESKVLRSDVSEIGGEEISSQLSGEIDVIIGGPPCQGYSLSGFRNYNDPRNILYKSFVKIVDYFKPKAFLMENVPGLERLFSGKALQEVLNDFANIGYVVTFKLMNSADYGVPQIRKRLFFVGLKGKEFIFPEPTHGDGLFSLPYITCEGALSDLPLLEEEAGHEPCEYRMPPQNDFQKAMRLNSKMVFNHTATIHKQKTVNIISMVPDGGNYKDLPKELWDTRRVNIAWTRMNSKKPCFTIDTGHNHHFHYKANRVPTVRESARIQSFPDSFIFWGNRTSQLRQVGNAVPPFLSLSLADRLREFL